MPPLKAMTAHMPAAFGALSGFSLRRNCVIGTRHVFFKPRQFACRPKLSANIQPQADKPQQPQSTKSATPMQPTKTVGRGKTLLLVGLGNTGPRYDNTRHNIGFALVDEFTRRNSEIFKIERRFQADVAKVQLADHTVHVVKPRTYMNNSGLAVKAVQKYYNVPNSALLIVTDDMSLNVGRIRLRAKGSAGGHNGLKSVQKSVGTMEYARLKVGVGSPDGSDEWKDFVLGTFSRGEQAVLKDVTWDVMGVLEHWVREPDLNRVINHIGMAQQTKSR